MLTSVVLALVEKTDIMLGSYGVQAEPRKVMVVENEFPSGMLARGSYSVKSRVTDFDNGLFAGACLVSSQVRVFVLTVTTPTQNGSGFSRFLRIGKLGESVER